jgi:hypothetical protein
MFRAVPLRDGCKSNNSIVKKRRKTMIDTIEGMGMMMILIVVLAFLFIGLAALVLYFIIGKEIATGFLREQFLYLLLVMVVVTVIVVLKGRI